MADIKEFGCELYITSQTQDKAYEKDAIVQCIQNMCFIKPGTYPKDPDLGLGIEDYQFELIDENFISNLKDKLDSMIDKYIITDYIIETRISYKLASIISNQKVLIIEVFVGSTIMDLTKIDLLFTRKNSSELKFNIMR